MWISYVVAPVHSFFSVHHESRKIDSEAPNENPFKRNVTVMPTIETIFAHILEMPIGFTYSCGKKTNMARAIIWEIASGPHVGLGECTCPLEASHTHLSALTPTACAILRPRLSSIVSGLIGRSAHRLESLLPDMPRKMDWESLVLREGLSIALYDLVGKAHGLPVHALLGGKRRDRVPGMPVIHTAPPDVMSMRAREWVTAGYRHLKIKPPGPRADNVEALRRIREAVGGDISIQVDGNQVYRDMPTAEQAVRELQPFDVNVFEDMLAGSLEQIAELRHRTGARIMVDHEASWPLVHEVCKAGAADIINHHPNNQGGLATALQIDAVATAAGIPTAIGSSGRFGIQDAAFQTLSCVVGLSRPCEDIGLTPYYSGPTKGEYAFDREPSVVSNPYPIVNGVIHMSDDPGLGIELDRKRLTASTVETFAFD